jgi:citrate/tricarballylate utilization protein
MNRPDARPGGVSGAHAPIAPDPEQEAARQLQICNACRYCEGFCAVFPAMTRRLEFAGADVHYLANLCHGCGACLHACQYAPPHEFAVNVPQAMARVRGRTYARYAWPAPLGRLFRRSGTLTAVALAAGVAGMLALAVALGGGTAALWRVPSGGFYDVIPHVAMAALFGIVFAAALVALAIGVRRFWRDVAAEKASGAAAAEATVHVLTLTYLDGGSGDGCPERDDGPTLARRRWHQLTFYGFGLCFAATLAATLLHYGLHAPAPYGWLSLPKLLGTTGGAMMVAGCIGLARLHARRHPDHRLDEQRGLDRGFITLLLVTAASGLVLALAHGTPAVPLLLCAHLGAVLALFATLPCGKFVHGVYRAAALLKWAVERRQPDRLRLGTD